MFCRLFSGDVLMFDGYEFITLISLMFFCMYDAVSILVYDACMVCAFGGGVPNTMIMF